MSAPRIALVGFTGTGKTTIAAKLIEELRHCGQPTQLLKLAAPLYRLQQAYYREAGVDLAPGAQDQELMAEIATRLRKISPGVLLDQFLSTLTATSPGTAIVNDDLRVPEPDATGLRAAGFCVIRLECPDDIRRTRLAGRNDRSTLDEPTIFGPLISRIPTELILNTHTATPTETVHRVLTYLRERHTAAMEVSGRA
jgi:cytidine deaminase